ncbi:MAG: hypothetical protein KZQ78_01760 [Candidatus Thiodiazotropha sp. (ex Ustalcina ferruginea)]|nr:hypothetical protein [Candidatus Thiodiazotropha sp. (ex Ustalcina ferruginea)]
MTKQTPLFMGLLINLLLSSGCTSVAGTQADQPQIVRDFEQMVTCQYFAANKYGEAITQINQLKQQGIVKPVKRSRGFQYHVVSELDLFGLKPVYIGHVHGLYIGPFARFEEDVETLVEKITDRGTKLVRVDSESDLSLYVGEKKGYWHLLLFTLSKKFLFHENPSIPFSAVDTTVVQCVYQGP